MRQHEADAFGTALMDFYQGKSKVYHIERDDNYLDAGDLSVYFTTYSDWSELEKFAMEEVSGRVLDIGCGAGRHSIYLQEKGFDVLGIDVSPLALEVSQKRGLKKTMLLGISEIRQLPGDSIDSVIMMGNNFGLLGSFASAREYLRQFNHVMSSRGRIVAITSDPYKNDDPYHLAYQKLNLSRGRMAGQIRFRIRYKTLINDRMDYLFASEPEVRAILEGTGWKLEKVIRAGSNERPYLNIITRA